MISLNRPSESYIRTFLSHQRERPYSYPYVGASFHEPPAGYLIDHNKVRLGEGQSVFEKARSALRAWAMIPLGWIEVWPPMAPIEAGTTVALLARSYRIWSLFACRIVRTVEDHGTVETFGFAYGTLPGHLLSGEERFLVRWDREDDSVWYDLMAFSRPHHPAGWLGYPLIRRVQKQFPPDSLRSMTLATGGFGP